jgi:hypothetical protein
MCKHVKKKVLVDFSDLPTDHLWRKNMFNHTTLILPLSFHKEVPLGGGGGVFLFMCDDCFCGEFST